jgi:hypothetical protein
VVGIKAYDVRPLRYCVNDANEFARMLVEKHGFAPEDVRILVDKEAGKAAIMNAFREHLVAGTKPGDTAIFYFSGHGTRVPDDNGDEPDGYDEALCPADSVGMAENVIRDDEMGALARQLAGRRFVAIYDSCHAGSGLRNLVGNKRAKFLPPSALERDPRKRGARDAEDMLPAAAAGQSMNLAMLFSDGSSDVPHPGPAAGSGAGGDEGASSLLIAACKAEETSSDGLEVEGKEQPYGAMTYYLIHGLRGRADTNGDGKVTGVEMQAFFDKAFPASQSDIQHPQVEGSVRAVGGHVLDPADTGAGSSTATQQNLLQALEGLGLTGPTGENPGSGPGPLEGLFP